MTSQIIAQNISWAPWSRLYLQVGFNYVLSETKTPAADYTQAILNAQNNYWTVNFNSGLALDDKTDLNLGYTYYQADNYSDPNPIYISYGAGGEEHAITATRGAPAHEKSARDAALRLLPLHRRTLRRQQRLRRPRGLLQHAISVLTG